MSMSEPDEKRKDRIGLKSRGSAIVPTDERKRHLIFNVHPRASADSCEKAVMIKRTTVW